MLRESQVKGPILSAPSPRPLGGPPAPPSQRDRLVAHLAMLLFSALIAGSFTLGALAVPHIAPAPLNAVRFALAAVLMGAFAFGLQRRPFDLPRAPWRFAIMGMLVAVYFVTMMVGLTMALPVAVSAVYTLVPLMAAAAALVLMGQRSGPAVLASLAIAGLGSIWVIFRADLAALLALRIGPGEMVFFVGCVCYAIYTPLLRKFSRGEPPVVQSFWTMTAAAVWIVAWSVPEFASVDWAGVPPFVWWSILYLAVGPTAICFFLVQFASLRLSSARVAAYGYLVPAYVIVLEGLAGRGWPSPGVLAGTAVIVLGLAVLAWLPER